jgi:E3 ubiquitin-protein ligase RNF139
MFAFAASLVLLIFLFLPDLVLFRIFSDLAWPLCSVRLLWKNVTQLRNVYEASPYHYVLPEETLQADFSVTLAVSVIMFLSLVSIYYRSTANSISVGRTSDRRHLLIHCCVSLCCLCYLALPFQYYYVRLLISVLFVAYFALMNFNMKFMYQVAVQFYQSCVNTYCTYGLQTFIELQLNRVNAYRLFIKYGIMFFVHCCFLRFAYHHQTANVLDTSVSEEYAANISQIVLKESLHIICGSFVGVLGLATLLSWCVNCIMHFLRRFVNISDANHPPVNEGTVAMTLFCLLAVQTGLTGLSYDERLTKLSRNLFLIFLALLHFVQLLVDEVLLQATTAPSLTRYRNIKCFVVLSVVIAVPLSTIVYLLCYSVSFGTWAFAVIAISFEVIVQSVVTVVLYALFVIDARNAGHWNNFDDFVYFAKATGRLLILLTSVALLCNGVWILVFESASIIRAIMILLHAYGNIYEQARSGWKKFMLRRKAMRQICTLPLASEDEINQFGSPCAICYQGLQPHTTRRTACLHLFHSACLRKWLFIQDFCPMCHRNVYYIKDAQAKTKVD